MSGNLEIVKTLVAANADINAPAPPCDYGETALQHASEKGHFHIVKYLLEKGADVNSKDNAGQIPLSLAVQNGHETVAQLLLEAKATFNTQERYYWAMLEEAAFNGRSIFLQLLTVKEVNSDTLSYTFEDLLQLGCITGHMAAVERILCLGANPNRADEHGWTPLLCASWFGQGQILDSLLSHGGRRDLLSHVNTTAPDSWSMIDKSDSLELDEDSISVKYVGGF
jgi:ankyrin repeat protein